ncbi:hypothetical protein NE237_018031 [Protea cynaroides]|uniref:Uncharacterized protein n=1 Tax=Protea cynaroides TaxID=273540 RepID=A0A9Q0K965_9MAGN|nr:hypothetical protein NE237_018031 [Protea cynaroides]
MSKFENLLPYRPLRYHQNEEGEEPKRRTVCEERKNGAYESLQLPGNLLSSLSRSLNDIFLYLGNMNTFLYHRDEEVKEKKKDFVILPLDDGLSIWWPSNGLRHLSCARTHKRRFGLQSPKVPRLKLSFPSAPPFGYFAKTSATSFGSWPSSSPLRSQPVTPFRSWPAKPIERRSRI